MPCLIVAAASPWCVLHQLVGRVMARQSSEAQSEVAAGLGKDEEFVRIYTASLIHALRPVRQAGVAWELGGAGRGGWLGCMCRVPPEKGSRRAPGSQFGQRLVRLPTPPTPSAYLPFCCRGARQPALEKACKNWSPECRSWPALSCGRTLPGRYCNQMRSLQVGGRLRVEVWQGCGCCGYRGAVALTPMREEAAGELGNAKKGHCTELSNWEGAILP